MVIQIQIQSSTQNSLYLCVPVEEIDNVVDACHAFYSESPDPLGHLLVVVDNLHQAQLLHLPPEASLLVVNKASLYYSLVAKDLLQGVLRSFVETEISNALSPDKKVAIPDGDEKPRTCPDQPGIM